MTSVSGIVDGRSSDLGGGSDLVDLGEGVNQSLTDKSEEFLIKAVASVGGGDGDSFLNQNIAGIKLG